MAKGGKINTRKCVYNCIIVEVRAGGAERWCSGIRREGEGEGGVQGALSHKLQQMTHAHAHRAHSRILQAVSWPKKVCYVFLFCTARCVRVCVGVSVCGSCLPANTLAYNLYCE